MLQEKTMRSTWIIAPLVALGLTIGSASARADSGRNIAGAVIVGATVGAVIGIIVAKNKKDRKHDKHVVVHHRHDRYDRRHSRGRDDKHGYGHRHGDRYYSSKRHGHGHSAKVVHKRHSDGAYRYRTSENVVIIRSDRDGRRDVRPRGRDYFASDRRRGYYDDDNRE